MTRFSAIFLGILCLFAVVFPVAAPAHEGHDEAPPAKLETAPRLTAEGSDLEIVATPKGHQLTIYLDRIATNEPVDGASIEISGDGIAPVKATPAGNGTYTLDAEWLDVPGTKALTFVVEVNGEADLLAGSLVIPGEAHEEDGAASGWIGFIGRPELWLLAITIGLGSFFLGFAFRPVRLPPDDPANGEAPVEPSKPASLRTLKNAAEIVLIVALLASALPRNAAAHEDHDYGAEATPAPVGSAPAKQPNGEVFMPKVSQRLLQVVTARAAVAKTQAATELVGTVISDPAHEGRVQAPMDGQIELASGRVSYVGEAVKAGDVLALLAPAMPVYERGTLAQVTADVEGKLRIAEQKLQRLTRISGDYIPQREIDDTRTEIESLRAQKRVLEPKNTERIELKAPVSGIISVANVRAGQVVSARDTLFELVEPKKIWIEAISIPGADDQGEVSSAAALDAEGHKIPLSYIGRAPALRQQALPLLFKVEDPHDSLAIGITVKVLVQYGKPIEGIIVPDAAVVRATNGLPQVWVKVAPERFAPRSVRIKPLDGDRVVVTAGLAPGDRVVVEAAELINQVR
jgi:cobalt-zinc-cadmium efflux system membrane fusion protein